MSKLKNIFFQFLLIVLSIISTQSEAQTLYAVSGASSNASYLYELNPSNGALIRTIGYTGYSNITGIAVHPKTGVMYGNINGDFGGSSYLVTINITTGAATIVGSHGFQSPDLAFDTAGVLYGWVENYDDICTFNLSTGTATMVSANYHGTYQTGLAFNSNNECYMKDGGAIHKFNATNGSKISTVYFSGGAHNLLAFNANDVCYTGQRSGSNFILKTIDVNTGALTTIGTSSLSNISAIAFGACRISNIASSNNPSSLGCRNCTDLTVTVSGAPTTYLWSTADTLKNISVCPTSTTVYKVVINGNSCLDSATFTQNVIDARHPSAGRVYMCQYQTSRRQWYTVSPYTTQITQMLAAGSKCGACNYSNKRNGDISFEGIEEIYSVFPNPAQNQITVESYNLNSEEVTIELVDMTGRVVLNIFNGFVMEGEYTQVSANISSLPNGMYFMRYSSASDLRVNKVQVVR